MFSLRRRRWMAVGCSPFISLCCIVAHWRMYPPHTTYLIGRHTHKPISSEKILQILSAHSARQWACKTKDLREITYGGFHKNNNAWPHERPRIFIYVRFNDLTLSANRTEIISGLLKYIMVVLPSFFVRRETIAPTGAFFFFPFILTTLEMRMRATTVH